MLSALAGFVGYGDIQTGTQIIKTNSTTYEIVKIYSNNIIFTRGIPIIEFLLGLYILIVLAVDSNQNDSRRKIKPGNKTE